VFTTFEQTQAYLVEQQIQMVDLKFCDLWGRWRHLTIPASQFTPSLLDEGVGFDGSAVGLKSVKAGDMVIVPDLPTGTLDPFWEVPTYSLICSTKEADTKRIFFRDPRNIAARAEAYLKETGIADESRWGPEFEFYIFDRVSFENEVNRAGYRLDSAEADWNSASGGHGHYIPLHGGYHAIPPKDALYNLRAAMTAHLEAMAVPVKYHHHEVGGPGQSEIETPLMGLVRAGDATMLVKYVAKMTAHARGQTVTFMPKPLYGEAGSGMHFHQHLFKGSKNLFYDANGYSLLSKTALHYIGGLLTHGAALLALTSPSTNSYRRLVPGFEAPVNAFFSAGNRSAAVRVPKYATGPQEVRIEFRPPDATCNVYLALAAQLMAGLDGIQRQLDPTEAGFGPIDENIFAWPPEKRATIKALPGTLREALEALERDNDFLLVGGVFDDELIADWIRHKLHAEYYEVRNRPHPYEVALYFDV
jgi:glutamine synthetase